MRILILSLPWLPAIFVGLFLISHLQAAPFEYTYPAELNVMVNRVFEPENLASLGTGETITVTASITNYESSDLRGFYYSNQIPANWSVNTIAVSVNGVSVDNYSYEQDAFDVIYTGFSPHRWIFEIPQGDGVFSPTQPIPGLGGAAEIIYTMTLNDGSGSDYSTEYEAWAGWLATSPLGMAVFGYQHNVENPPGTATHTPSMTPLPTNSPSPSATPSPKKPTAGFVASSRSGAPPLTVAFTDLSTGNIDSWYWCFGDGHVSTIQNLVHTYSTPGQYSVTLEVDGAYGSDILILPQYIHVYDMPFRPYVPIILKRDGALRVTKESLPWSGPTPTKEP